jgi:hypothetical protein
MSTFRLTAAHRQNLTHKYIPPPPPQSDCGTLVPRFNVETELEWDFYWNKCTLYTKMQTLLKHYYMYSTLFIEITQSV